MPAVSRPMSFRRKGAKLPGIEIGALTLLQRLHLGSSSNQKPHVHRRSALSRLPVGRRDEDSTPASTISECSRRLTRAVVKYASRRLHDGQMPLSQTLSSWRGTYSRLQKPKSGLDRSEVLGVQQSAAARLLRVFTLHHRNLFGRISNASFLYAPDASHRRFLASGTSRQGVARDPYRCPRSRPVLRPCSVGGPSRRPDWSRYHVWRC